MHPHLVGLHIAPQDCAAIARAVEAANPGVTCTWTSIVHGQGGASYEQLARECRYAGVPGSAPISAWTGLRATHAVPAADGYILASWSAGYGYTRELLRGVEGRPGDVVVVALLDSDYDDLALSHLAVWTALAGEAVAGGCSFVAGASDIDYMERPPTPVAARYASTARVTRAIASSVGLAVEPIDYPAGRPSLAPLAEACAGSLVLRLFDIGPGVGPEEHVAAVRGWGPALVAEGVRMYLAERPVAPTEPPPSTLPAPVPSAPPSRTHDLHPGDRGGDVVAMQRAIGVEPDGSWGPGTARGLSTFQRSTGIPVRPVWGDAERAAAAACVRGIDVSHHQPPIDWPRVRAAGYEFVVVRSGDGTMTDRRCRQHFEGSGRAGLGRMGYHFTRAGMPIAPQVACAVAALPEVVGWWVDLEDGRSAAQVAARVRPTYHTDDERQLAHRMLLATARRVGDYSAFGWWEACHLPELEPDAPVWSAGRHGDHLPGDALQVPGGVDRWVMYQPRTAVVPGVVGACDVNLWARRELLSEWAT